MIRPRLRRDGEPVAAALATVAGIAALLAAAFAVLGHEFATGWQPLIVLAAFAHQLMWAAPLAVVLFAVVRRWFATAAAVVVLLLAAVTQAPLYAGADVAAGGDPLTVLQANLRVGSADPVALVRLVLAHRVDVLMTEELTPTERDRLVAAGLATALPHRFDASLAGGGGGLAIWSRYPMTPQRNLAGFELGVLQAVVHPDVRSSITVIAAHLLPPYPYPSVEWSREMRRLGGVMRAAADGAAPVVLAGDLNATTDHAQFRELLTLGYDDAVEHCGAGYLPTYPTDRFFPPVIAIDHVLSRGAPARNAVTLDLPGSDHRALLVHLRAMTSATAHAKVDP